MHQKVHHVSIVMGLVVLVAVIHVRVIVMENVVIPAMVLAQVDAKILVATGARELVTNLT